LKKGGREMRRERERKKEVRERDTGTEWWNKERETERAKRGQIVGRRE
jgi:hypothetical protein